MWEIGRGERGSDRGQAFTLEAIVASMLLLSGLVFALQVTAVTPLSASTSSQHIENQQEAVSEGVLAVTDDTGALKRAVLFWGEEDGVHRFHDASGEYYVNTLPANEFGDVIEKAYRGQGVAYNVYVHFQTDTGSYARQRVAYNGAPSDNAVSATRTLTLYDSDVLYDSNEDATTARLGDDTTEFYAPDIAPDDGLFNVVRVEIVVWRM